MKRCGAHFNWVRATIRAFAGVNRGFLSFVTVTLEVIGYSSRLCSVDVASKDGGVVSCASFYLLMYRFTDFNEC